MSEFFLFLVVCPSMVTADRGPDFEVFLGKHGRVASVLPGTWFLAADVEDVEDEYTHGDTIIDAIIDGFGEGTGVAVMNIDNVAAYQIEDDAEVMLDELFSMDDDEDDDGDEEE